LVCTENLLNGRKGTTMYESLESRRLFAVALVGSQLQVTGTGGNDNIQVSQQDAATIRVSDNGAVSLFNDANVSSILINGLAGNDSLFALVGSGATFLGEAATINGGDGNDSIRGAGGSDALRGDAGNDSLSGDAGNDRLDGGTGNNNLSGGDGNDTLTAGTGNDNMSGGNGNDTADYSSRTANLTISQDGLANDGQPGFIPALAERDNVQENIETILGGSGSDRISAGPGVVNNSFKGNAGNDTLNLRSGIDTGDGGSGADTVAGGAGNDVLFGGTGDDVLAGGGGNDQLRGGDGNDVLDGGLNADQLFGENGNDVLLAADGAADLVLNGGNDTDLLDRDGADPAGVAVEIII
jgi:Ca2+-binding RTX toxin-like protein